MPSDWVRRSVFTRTPTATTVDSKTRCSAPYGWWWIPASIAAFSAVWKTPELKSNTGLHAKRWSREQAIQYFRSHLALDETEVHNEVDRYIVWPAQALGYKIGELKILELRERARKELGDRFDLRRFHQQILAQGVLPLDVLEKRIDNWIAAEK